MFDRFIRWVFSMTGHCDWIDKHFREGRYCFFCRKFVMDLDHTSRRVCLAKGDKG